MYPLAHRAISLVFGARCTRFLLASESVHSTYLSPGRGHHPLACQRSQPCKPRPQPRKLCPRPRRPRSPSRWLRPTAMPMLARGPALRARFAYHLCCSPAVAADPHCTPRCSPRPHAAVALTRANPASLPWPLLPRWRVPPCRLLRCA